MTTKEQERKALEQIKKIVDCLGENSYIGTAFEGCFEIAEENIECDFGNSTRYYIERSRELEEKIKWYEDVYEKEAKRELKIKESLIEEYKTGNENLRNSLKEYKESSVNFYNKFREQEDKVEALQQEIIRLKARLFDMMEAQGA